MKVYVKSIKGKPLMPCPPVIARLLLKQGKAKVLRRTPFTIKLLYISEEYVQNLTLGVDTGSSTVGTSVIDEKGKVLYMSKIEIRNDITSKMTRRREYRRNRRNRKTRYRKPRFLNRKNSKRTDRFSPTMISKISSHIKEIEYIKSILPIVRLVLETGKFDTALLAHPGINKHWGYQKGLRYGFSNLREAILARDNYTCQCCKGASKDKKLQVHHILFRSHGGTDTVENLTTLCSTCHKKVHKDKIFLSIKSKKSITIPATQMNSIRKQLLKIYPKAIETFGYITKENRFNLGLPKDHHIDACVIASGGNPVTLDNTIYIKRSVAKGDYQQTKGIRSEKKIPTRKIMGFRKFDKVEYFGKEYFIKGRRTAGTVVLSDIHGVSADFSNRPKGCKTPKMKDLTRISSRKTILITMNYV